MFFEKLKFFFPLFFLQLLANAQSLEISYSNGVGISPYRSLSLPNSNLSFIHKPFYPLGWGLGSVKFTYLHPKLKNHQISQTFMHFGNGAKFEILYYLPAYNGYIKGYSISHNMDVYAISFDYAYKINLGKNFSFNPGFRIGMIMKSRSLKNSGELSYLYYAGNYNVPTSQGDKSVAFAYGYALQNDFNILFGIDLSFKKYFGKRFFMTAGIDYLLSPISVNTIKLAAKETDGTEIRKEFNHHVNMIRFNMGIGGRINLIKGKKMNKRI